LEEDIATNKVDKNKRAAMRESCFIFVFGLELGRKKRGENKKGEKKKGFFFKEKK